jgi:tRNA(Ile)-lysidine synthase
MKGGKTLLDCVIQAIERHSMFEPGQRAGVAVSGGADSMCLLHVLRELAPRFNLTLLVLHLDHGLRGDESRADADFVRRTAAGLGLEYEELAVQLEPGNIEQAARAARRDFFLRVLREGRAGRVALGHTRSDQAETVLFRFLRGSGSAGLAGIRPVTSEGFVRPLIDVERSQVLDFLQRRGIAWREDSSNQSRSFARNRIRHDLLPALTREWNPALTQTLAQTAAWALREEEYWDAEVSRLARQHLEIRPPAVLMRAGALSSMPVAAARRLIRRAIHEAKGDLRSVDFEHVEFVLALGAGGGRVQIAGLDVRRSFDWIRIAPPEAPVPYRYAIPIPGEVALPDGVLSAEITENTSGKSAADCRYNSTVSCLDWSRITGTLEVRNWRPGDRYQPVGHAGEEKLKALFQRARIPVWERSSWPVVVRLQEIVWARGFGPAEAYAAGSESRSVLVLRDRMV